MSKRYYQEVPSSSEPTPWPRPADELPHDPTHLGREVWITKRVVSADGLVEDAMCCPVCRWVISTIHDWYGEEL